MKKVHVFALLAFAAGLFSCTSDVESAEDVLAQLGRSSSTESSSSVFVPSSSSVLPSSSGVAPSSSSLVPSSSSQQQSSSSVVPSSSSALAVSNCEGMAGAAVTIGSQTWMKSNLNCNVSGSKCYDNDPSNCDTYGRLYDWAAAMALPSSCNSSTCSGQISTPHRGICPSGWHIPSNADWDKLYRYADGTSGTGSPYDSPTAGRYLKATSGWYNCGPSGSGSSFLCEDAHGFSALPGGYGYSGGSFYVVGGSGRWWSSDEDDATNAYLRYMSYGRELAYWLDDGKSNLFSVRCVKD